MSIVSIGSMTTPIFKGCIDFCPTNSRYRDYSLITHVCAMMSCQALFSRLQITHKKPKRIGAKPTAASKRKRACLEVTSPFSAPTTRKPNIHLPMVLPSKL